MKKLLLLSALILSSSAFASDLETTIKEIESDRNARCEKVDTSMGVCFGPTNMNVCFYSVKFDCVSNDGNFSLKVKMKNSKVRKVIFLK